MYENKTLCYNQTFRVSEFLSRILNHSSVHKKHLQISIKVDLHTYICNSEAKYHQMLILFAQLYVFSL